MNSTESNRAKNRLSAPSAQPSLCAQPRSPNALLPARPLRPRACCRAPTCRAPACLTPAPPSCPTSAPAAVRLRVARLRALAALRPRARAAYMPVPAWAQRPPGPSAQLRVHPALPMSYSDLVGRVAALCRDTVQLPTAPTVTIQNIVLQYNFSCSQVSCNTNPAIQS